MPKPSGQAELHNFGEINPREEHRERFWDTHDREGYTCPDCGRDGTEIDCFEVHHKDRNPYNGDPDNLVALCFRCHKRRHRREEREGRIEGWESDWDDLLLDEDAADRRQDGSVRPLDEIA